MRTRAYGMVTAAMLFAFSTLTLAGTPEVLWLGHATVRITSVDGKVIVIDPFLSGNPKTPEKYKKLDALGNVDLILVTHGHGDHIADLSALAKLTGAQVVANAELVRQMAAMGLLDKDKIIAMNKGGTVTPLGEDIKVHMVSADHSSSLDISRLTGEGTGLLDAGAPVGYVIELENGFKIYHSGDTGVFGDMALIGKLYAPDLALVCIGGQFTMDPEGAAYAMAELIKPRQIIPIHYGTFPMLKGTPGDLKEALGDAPIEVLDVKPGDALRF
jgi:L-ascorbate metabolism protein UlaG (beta-lactamase superfamily)